MHKQNLNSLSPQDREELARQIQRYVTPTILRQHANPPSGVHTDGTIFLSWHRNYIAGLERYLVDRGFPEWSPLPAWNPAECIPVEFDIRIQEPCPNISFSPNFDSENLVNFRNDEDLGQAIMEIHNDVHNVVGGDMANIPTAPRAPIFWPWHSFVDDIWWDWQRLSIIVPDCIGLSRTRASRLLISSGLTVGNVILQPHTHPPSFPQRHRHVVVDQSPEPNVRVQSGLPVDLALAIL
ncbi:MAG: hypothetical protein FIB08_15220 [Candidatus Methanoperedens sp.]|nr:hypothetical protein [Candidatus Methanoperedens sp.]